MALSGSEHGTVTVDPCQFNPALPLVLQQKATKRDDAVI